MTLKILFWLFLGIIIYAYVGYTLLLLIASGAKKLFSRQPVLNSFFEPDVTLIIPAYNEETVVTDKVNNTLALDYPSEKLKVIWITDGSTDKTPEMLSRYEKIMVLHESERKGKIHAMNRGMKAVNTPFVIFTDANSMLNPEAIKEIIKPFAETKTGCVTGEKRIASSGKQKAVGAGEGLYWKYESFIKRLESETGSVVGAVGEIFAIRSDLYEDVNEDTLLDDFTLSLQMICKGYAVKYAPGAFGIESASLSIAEEIKRKIRIASGGMQSLLRMTELLNPFKHGMLSLKYISHKVLRWAVVPFSFALLFIVNLCLLFNDSAAIIYAVFFGLQCLFYLMALTGRIFENARTNMGILFSPYYLFIMNYAVLIGIFKYISGNYSVKWQKARRT